MSKALNMNLAAGVFSFHILSFFFLGVFIIWVWVGCFGFCFYEDSCYCFGVCFEVLAT